MANSNGWGDGAANNAIGWGQGANNTIGWGSSHATSWAGATDIVGLTTDPSASAFIAATGITGATQQSAVDALVKGLKADGIWTKMKAVYPFVTDNRNIIKVSQDFTNGEWINFNIPITANTTIAPDGTLTADTADVQNNPSGNRINQVVTVTPNTTYTFSFYSKRGTATSLKYSAYDATNGADIVVPTSYYSQTSSTNWSRISFTFTTPNNCTALWIYPLRDTGALGTSFLWGAQLELGSTATTYQPIATTQQAYIAAQFKYNLVNPVDSDAAFRLVFNGGWTHSSNGATPNGTNGYADTKLNLLSNYGTTFNNHFSVYYRTAGQFSEKIGAYGSFYENGMSAHIQQNGTVYYNDNMGRTVIGSTSSAIAYHISSLLSTSSNAQKLYRNNAILGSGTANILSTYPSLNFYFGGANNNGTPSQYSSRQTAFSTIGDGLTDTEASNLYTRVQTYQTALSRNV
jgi:hypothetical protein